MIRGGNFYAVWNDDLGKWMTDESDLIDMIDTEMEKFKRENESELGPCKIMYMWNSKAGSIDDWVKYISRQVRSDNFHPLDETLVFSNTPRKRENYSSKELSYALEPGDHKAWDELVDSLYEPSERHKIEWAIGSVIAGDSKWIQKFFVFYGAPGTGKSTILNVIQELFKGYWTAFNSQALGNSNSDFALEPLKENPLVGIDHEGELSRIETNVRLNSLVSHETMSVNTKFGKMFPMAFHTMLFIGTNKPVRITDSKSGIIRRLIDISSTGKKIPNVKYNRLVKEIGFELGAIAQHCLEVYQADPHYYDDYTPIKMMGATNHFWNFMEEYAEEFTEKGFTTLTDAWFKYRLYCDEAKVSYPYSKMVFKEELKNYFNVYKERARVQDKFFRNYYSGLKIEKFEGGSLGGDVITEDVPEWLRFDTTESQFDKIGKDWPAQYAFIRNDGSDKPMLPWEPNPNKPDIPYCETVLADLNTSELHYVRPPEEIRKTLVTVDFDKKDPETGEKSLELNIKAASLWPETYAELSKSEVAIHLEYFYTGDVSKLMATYEKDVEIKVFTGKASLRRKLTRCNKLPIATITSGLPLRKEDKKIVDEYVIKDQKHLINLINKALRKEVEPGATVTCVDFIGKVLEDAYNSGITYDVRDMKAAILAFAGSSHNHSLECLDKAQNFHYTSETEAEWTEPPLLVKDGDGKEKRAFFDTEVFPNLFILVYKPEGEDCIPLINPSGSEVLEVFQKYQMIGYNNLGYDNSICMARIRGESLYELFVRSQNIINAPKGRNDWIIREAKNLSYTDVFDFCSKKQSLKKWEIELQKQGVNIRHDEAGLPWDKEVPKNKWKRVAEYCCNDVIATEEVFKANQSDFRAREVLVELANALRGPGSTVNDSTNTLTTKLIVGNEKNPQAMFVYPNLAERFPGYEFNKYCFPISRYMLEISPKDTPANPAKYELYECTFDNSGAAKYVPTKDTNAVFGKQYYRKTMISGKSFYKGFDPGEGGFVYAEWGMYLPQDEGKSAADCYDSASHHPSSLIAENGFGPYTDNFKMLLAIRLHIKHKDYDWVRGLYDGILAPYLTSDKDAKQLSYALKIAINSVYGLTAANFQNKLRDPRNEDNWVAKRGALFMIDLMLEVQKRGYRVIHIKTDSIKIANPDPKIFQFVYDYGKKFGYTFEVEHKFERLCLVNNAVYVCKYTNDPENGDMAGKWDATGDQFKEPYVFKTLFSHEPIDFWDLCVTQTVKVGLGLYLDMDEKLPDSTALEKEEDRLVKKWHKVGFELNAENDANLSNGFAPNLTDIPDKKVEQYAQNMYHADYVSLCEIREKIRKCHDYNFVGKAGLFCPIMPGCGGGRLVRENNGKYAYAAGAKGYRWMEAEMVRELGFEDRIDMSYFEALKQEAIRTISEFGDYESFADII